MAGTLDKEFKKQLDSFKKKDFGKEYRAYHPLGSKVLVKLFKFVPENAEESLGSTQILVQSTLDRTWKPKTQALTEKIFPILKSGMKKDFMQNIMQTRLLQY